MDEHAIREYLKTIGSGGGGVSEETDPVFTASPAHGISAQDIADWNDKQDELVSGTNIKTINSESLLGSGNINIQGGGGSKNIWYATCSTSASTQAKVATTDSQNFVLATGNMVRVKFEYANTYNGTSTLNVDGTGAKDIARVGTTKTTRYYWTGGEVVDFVYDGTNYVMSAKGTATTSQYGLTKLSNSTSSTSEAIAATPKAVKAAYDEATDATEIPTREKKSKFDTDGHMNSTDMTTGADSELEDFIDGLNVSGGDDTGVQTLVTGIKYRRRNGIVYVDGYASGSSPTLNNSYQVLGTLPSGFRPYETLYEVLGTNSANCGVAYVGANGAIGAKTFTGTTSYYWFHFVFVADN